MIKPHTLLLCALFAFAARAGAGEIAVTLPQGVQAASGTAAARGAEKLNLQGRIGGESVTFANAQPGMAYDLRLVLADGRELRGVDLGWYSLEPGDSAAGPLTDEDRAEMQEICNVPSFYNRCEMLKIEGNHDRASALMQLVRDTDFHAGKGQIIWRAEVWYFKFQAGGWEKVKQQNSLLERRRFAGRAEYEKAVRPIRFVPSLGGLSVSKSNPRLEVKLTAGDLAQAIATTAPATLSR